MKKILILGDTHGNNLFVSQAIAIAKEHECDAILQLGDFGYWEHMDNGRGFLKKVSKTASHKDMPIYWLDGNHENHPMLWEKYGPGEYAPFWRIRENLFYIPRGTVWEWGGTTFAAMGGAVSVDKAWRTPGYSWWPEEEVRQEDLGRLAENAEDKTIDVLVTHDAPLNPLPRSMGNYKCDDMSRHHQQVIKQVAKDLQPKLHMHGHFHYFHDTDTYYGRVVGLNCDGTKDSYAILELPSLNLTFPWLQ